jgi:hypothetical protein
MASNFWKTIQPILAGGRDVDLPPAMLAAVQAEAHAWIGKESLAHGDRQAARQHLRESLRHQALSPGVLALYALAWGPAFSYPAARALVRAAKRAARVFGFGLG